MSGCEKCAASGIDGTTEADRRPTAVQTVHGLNGDKLSERSGEEQPAVREDAHDARPESQDHRNEAKMKAVEHLSAKTTGLLVRSVRGRVQPPGSNQRRRLCRAGLSSRTVASDNQPQSSTAIQPTASEGQPVSGGQANRRPTAGRGKAFCRCRQPSWFPSEPIVLLRTRRLRAAGSRERTPPGLLCLEVPVNSTRFN